MSSVQMSQADLLREFVEKKFAENYDFSKSSYKKNAIKEFVDEHPELKTNATKIGKHFGKILKEVADQKGKAPEQVGLKRPRVNPAMAQAASDMNATIEGVPQSAQANLVGAPAPDTNMQSQQQQAIPGGQMQGPQPYVNPNMTVESVGALVQGGMAGIKSILPELELLTDEEKNAAGQILLPPMQRI